MEKSFELTELERDFKEIVSEASESGFIVCQSFKLGMLVYKASLNLSHKEYCYFDSKVTDYLKSLVDKMYERK